jgi:hypothetical protein
MLTVAGNHSGFHVVTALPKGLRFNAGYYIQQKYSKKSKIGGRDRELAALEN